MYLVGFVIFSALLLVFTLVRSQPYRFFRFAAFECLLGLIFWNGSRWFVNPFSFRQILSWILMAASAGLAVGGFILLKNRGAPGGDFENTTQLVTTGLYRWIRHPMYGSLLLFGTGAFLKDITPLSGSILIGLMISIQLTAVQEEQQNLATFGDSYRQYMERTKRFIPFLY